MIVPVNIRADFVNLNGSFENRIIATDTPVISWGGYTDVKDNFQTAYRIVVKHKDELLWDTGRVNSGESFAEYKGRKLPEGKRIDLSVSVAGNDGVMSCEANEHFYVGTMALNPDGKWICSSKDEESKPVYFKKKFTLTEKIEDAALYISSMGFVNVSINGMTLPLKGLNPAHSDYNKTCWYCLIPELSDLVHKGENSIDITLADGWRRNWGDYLRIYNNTPAFFGTPAVWSALKVTYSDGRVEWITTDETWTWSEGKTVFSHLFDGETYDENSFGGKEQPVSLYEGTCGELTCMRAPNITEHKTILPTDICYPDKEKAVVDFGTNFSGVVRIRIPRGMKKGSRITIRHAQLTDDKGFINNANLRGAKCEDTYIFSGNEPDMEFWQPEFTYHGFRYAEVTGYPMLTKEDILGVMICTDLEGRMTFNTGCPTINAIHNMLVHTEKSTTHGAFNDTCGRSERMHWLDDGMVRYPEIPYNFEAGRIYPHILHLIRDTQHPDGSVTCTAPHIYGKRPGDPLSSSYLLLGDELYTKYGNYEALREYYPAFCSWQNCLLNNSTDFIMNYSYYGDWAGPEYSRDPETIGGGAGSATIPPCMVGTGIFMHNARMLKKFAHILGKTEDEKYYSEMFENIKQSFLKKWYNPETRRVYNGSQSCQALALWLDILPEEHSKAAAEIMHSDLVGNNYRFTTGVFCLRFMCEMLIKYGYVDTYYELMSRDEYPSFGNMIKLGATTGWEKYEFLTGGSMNAHIHAFQISVFATFYEYIAGVSLKGHGGEVIDINPHYPRKLHTLDMTYSTIRGDVTVKWKRLSGRITLCVNVPFNVKANVHTPMGVKTCGSGLHTYQWEENALKGA